MYGLKAQLHSNQAHVRISSRTDLSFEGFKIEEITDDTEQNVPFNNFRGAMWRQDHSSEQIGNFLRISWMASLQSPGDCNYPSQRRGEIPLPVVKYYFFLSLTFSDQFWPPDRVPEV